VQQLFYFLPAPFSQANWPNPVLRVVQRITLDPPYLLDRPLNNPTPFIQSDWQNPTGPEFPLANRGFTRPFADLDSIPPAVIPPEETVVVVGGGRVYDFKYPRTPTREEISKARQRFGLEDETAKIILDIASRQAESLERDSQKRFEELNRELKLKDIEWDRKYLEALNAERERLIDAEIALRLRQKLDDEEVLMLLALMAGLM
jgi:hypothetical protein